MLAARRSQSCATAVLERVRKGSRAVRYPTGHRRTTPHVTAESVAAIAVLGVVGTGFAYVLNYQIITSEGATIASTVTYLLPVVAIVLGVLVLDESITVPALVGVAVVLAGVALTRRQQQTLALDHVAPWADAPIFAIQDPSPSDMKVAAR